jgi:hypothetical protein
MTTSGSYDFSLDRDGLITEAYELTGAVAIGVAPTTAELTSGGRTLNLMLKGWQTEGIALWLNQKVTLLLGYGTESYLLGPTGDNASATVVKTEVATAAESGDSSLVLDSITGMTDGDYVGIELDDGTVQWTTINGVPADATIVLAAVLTDDVAVGNHVYTYTTKIQRPLEIVEGRRISPDNILTPLLPISRQEYMALSDKSSSGIVTQFYYDPQLTNGALYVWPTCADVKDTLEFTIKKPIMDFDATDDDGEFPPEWTEPIVLNLAVRIGIKLGIPLSKELKDLAATAKFMAMTYDTEKTSTFFQPKVK